ncbi:hypothetical protein SK224_07960 [Microbacterium sp. BG28]|uniref:hypothetical protein n=1 Tax=Microbacterium sp. BG28 TaxID=3097356 RepID=UPI002A59E98D|nr:hypothetical protein [Microbacterium sp. BG28]MDY0829061.1 hypothetical protein [Microbacterium sp. BG28]
MTETELQQRTAVLLHNVLREAAIVRRRSIEPWWHKETQAINAAAADALDELADSYGG